MGIYPNNKGSFQRAICCEHGKWLLFILLPKGPNEPALQDTGLRGSKPHLAQAGRKQMGSGLRITPPQRRSVAGPWSTRTARCAPCHSSHEPRHAPWGSGWPANLGAPGKGHQGDRPLAQHPSFLIQNGPFQQHQLGGGRSVTPNSPSRDLLPPLEPAPGLPCFSFHHLVSSLPGQHQSLLVVQLSSQCSVPLQICLPTSNLPHSTSTTRLLSPT